MTQFNHDDIINAEYEENRTHTAPYKKSRNRHGGGIPNIVLTAALSLACGAGGGIIATKAMKKVVDKARIPVFLPGVHMILEIARIFEAETIVVFPTGIREGFLMSVLQENDFDESED